MQHIDIEQEFINHFDVIKSYCLDDLDLTKELHASVKLKLLEYYSRCIEYNSKGGKLLRGLLLCRCAIDPSNPELSNLEYRNIVYSLGWAIELLQAFFLVADDIMDNSLLRRGQSSWFQVTNLANGVNDSFFLETCVYKIIDFVLSKYESTQAKSVLKIWKLFHEVCRKTVIGQHMDTNAPDSLTNDILHANNSSPQLVSGNNLNNASLSLGKEAQVSETKDVLSSNIISYYEGLYYAIIHHKTSYYTFFLPLKLSMLLRNTFGVSEKAEHEKIASEIIVGDSTQDSYIHKVSMMLGALFQIQDDYLDCYACKEVLGKEGTDIKERKLTFLFLMILLGLKDADTDINERKHTLDTIQHSYGVNEAEIKALYSNKKLVDKYISESDDLTGKITELISHIHGEHTQTQILYILHLIQKRNK